MARAGETKPWMMSGRKRARARAFGSPSVRRPLLEGKPNLGGPVSRVRVRRDGPASQASGPDVGVTSPSRHVQQRRPVAQQFRSYTRIHFVKSLRIRPFVTWITFLFSYFHAGRK